MAATAAAGLSSCEDIQSAIDKLTQLRVRGTSFCSDINLLIAELTVLKIVVSSYSGAARKELDKVKASLNGKTTASIISLEQFVNIYEHKPLDSHQKQELTTLLIEYNDKVNAVLSTALCPSYPPVCPLIIHSPIVYHTDSTTDDNIPSIHSTPMTITETTQTSFHPISTETPITADTSVNVKTETISPPNISPDIPPDSPPSSPVLSVGNSPPPLIPSLKPFILGVDDSENNCSTVPVSMENDENVPLNVVITNDDGRMECQDDVEVIHSQEELPSPNQFTLHYQDKNGIISQVPVGITNLQISTDIKPRKLSTKGKWSEEAVDLLVKLVNLYGEGKWRLIMESDREGVFPIHITNVNLKDKWRNLIRYHHVVRNENFQWVRKT